MIVCYIAGPYTATDGFTVEQNIDNARKVSSEIRSNDMAAIVPHLESIGCADALDYDGWIEHGIAVMRKCDCLVLVDGWEMSKGAKREVEDAKWNEKPIFFSWESGYLQDIKQRWENNKWKK